LLDEYFTVQRLDERRKDDRLTTKEIYNYVSDLKSSVGEFCDIVSPEDSRDVSADATLWLGRLRRLQRALAFRDQDIMLVMQMAHPKLAGEHDGVRHLKAIERHFFLSAMIPYRIQKKIEGKSVLSDLMKISRDNAKGLQEFIEKVEQRNDEVVRHKDFMGSFVDALGNGGYYGWRALRYFLYEYECHLQSVQRRKTTKIDWNDLIRDDFSHDHTSVEHVLPQSMKNQPYWKDRFGDFESKQLKRIRNSLGNLVATSQPRNSAMQNKPFLEKRDGVEPSGVAYRSGSYSELEIAKENDWTAQHILDRGVRMLDFAGERWALPLPLKKEEKAKILGLEFLLKREARRGE
jgi:hypothetical protein